MKLRIVMKGLLVGSAALAILTAIIVAITVLTTPASVEDGAPLPKPSAYSSAAETHEDAPVRARRATSPQTTRLAATPFIPIATNSRAATPATVTGGVVDDDGRFAIFAALQSTNHLVRMQAIEAAKQLDGPEVVIRLREIAAQLDDPHENVALLDAIDYVSLPSYSDLAIVRRRERQARGLPPTRVAVAPREARQPSSSHPRLRGASPAGRTTSETAPFMRVENGTDK